MLETDRPIGVYDNFFDLGGHSLQAALLTTRIREMFRVDISLRDIFSAPDLATLAAHLDRAAPTAGPRP